jgi:hypothetical protein
MAESGQHDHRECLGTRTWSYVKARFYKPPTAVESNIALTTGAGFMILGVALQSAKGTIASDSLIALGALLLLVGTVGWLWRYLTRRFMRFSVVFDPNDDMCTQSRQVSATPASPSYTELFLRVRVESTATIKGVRLEITRSDSAGTGWLGLKGDHSSERDASSTGETLFPDRPLHFDVVMAAEGRTPAMVVYAHQWLMDNYPIADSEQFALQAFGFRSADGADVRTKPTRYELHWDCKRLEISAVAA